MIQFIGLSIKCFTRILVPFDVVIRVMRYIFEKTGYYPVTFEKCRTDIVSMRIYAEYSQAFQIIQLRIVDMESLMDFQLIVDINIMIFIFNISNVRREEEYHS